MDYKQFYEDLEDLIYKNKNYFSHSNSLSLYDKIESIIDEYKKTSEDLDDLIKFAKEMSFQLHCSGYSQGNLMTYLEEQFNQDFNSFGMSAEDVKSKYKNELGEIAALKLDFTTEQLFGEAIGLRRIDTTDLDLVSNEEGEIKPNWSVKQVNGQELTHEGALIYSTVEFCEVGQESIRLKQDQDLRSNTIGENIPQAAKVAAPF
jgi:hypothetical protein